MTLSVDLLRLIDTCCDRYEAAWLEGAAPRAEDFVAELPEAAREAALHELRQIEVHYRGLATIASRDKPSPSAIAELRIRCPHCQGGVEVLADAPLDEITCGTCGSTFGLVDSPGSEELAPRSVGRFRLVERLGVGGFGAVWRARDPELDRDVAIKLPRRGQLGPRETELFFREARAAAQLAHPNIVPVHEVGRDESPGAGRSVYIVSELIDGEPLSRRLERERYTPRETAALLATVSDALHYAHERGVVHRDLKPSNLMLNEEGVPYLMDFGLAKRSVGEITMTIEGQILGTPAYMSPEQAGGELRWVDRRTDLYSLGVMLFQMLTGELPFRGTAQSQIQQRQTDDAPHPRRFNEQVPLDLATICLKCLEREPTRRYASAEEVANELRRFVRGEPVLARPLTRLQRTVRWARRRPASAAAICLGTILAVAGPAAALTIALQNREIASQLESKQNQIATDAQTIDQLRQQRDTLRDQLAGTPQTSANSSTQAMLAQEWLDQHGEQAIAMLEQTAPDSIERARGLLGMGLLLSMAEREGEAAARLEQAEPLLNALAESDDRWRELYSLCRRQLLQLQLGRGEPLDPDAEIQPALQELAELERLRDAFLKHPSADTDMYEIATKLTALDQLPSAPTTGD